MKKVRKVLSILLTAAMLLSVCASGVVTNAAVLKKREVVIYFSNQNVYEEKLGGQVKDLPWDRVSYINHAFWEIKPENGNYNIVSTDPWADTDAANPKAHFTQYAEYTAKYPEVNVLISIGGESHCGYFSEMALTAESRKTFIDSCIDTLKAYPWLAGIDIDWEFPGVERLDGENDQGNPVKGDDFNNYTSLLKEIRQAFDAEFGAGVKKLTVCSSVDTEIIAKQDIAAFAPYVDLINIMSYDMTDSSATVTGHQTMLHNSDPNGLSTDKGVRYYINKGVPASKINIGTPLYCRGWAGVRKSPPSYNAIGVPGSSSGYIGDMYWKDLKDIQYSSYLFNGSALGWHIMFSESYEETYLYNDDPNSNYYQNLLTYESQHTLQAKLNYVNTLDLAGIMVWESYGDSSEDDYPMITQMANEMGLNSKKATLDNNLLVMKSECDYAVLNRIFGHTTKYGEGRYARLKVYEYFSAIPLRYLAEATGFLVDYEEATKQTKVTNSSTGEYLLLTTNSTFVTKHDASGLQIDSANAPTRMIIDNGILVVPIRFICEALGLHVYYEDRTVTGRFVVVSTEQKTDEEFSADINLARKIGL